MARPYLHEDFAGCLRVGEERHKCFKMAVAEHGFRIYKHNLNGERDIPDRHWKDAEGACWNIES
jgi:hypothetical protein